MILGAVQTSVDSDHALNSGKVQVYAAFEDELLAALPHY